MSGRHEVLRTDAHWDKVKRFIPKVEHPKAGRPKTDAALRAFYRFSKAVLAGEIYQEIFSTQNMLEKIGGVG